MAQQQPTRRKTQSGETLVSIPDKLYFRIGDVARLCGLPAYVLRFWETEFPQLKPNKGGTGHRLYRKRDVEMVLQIKHLLYSEGFTIAGARRLLAEKRRGTPIERNSFAMQILEDTHAPQPTKAAPVAPESVLRKNAKVLPSVQTRPAPDAPRLKDIRREMQDLLTLLASDHSERAVSSAPPPVTQSRVRRVTKKGDVSNDEPTLFS